MHNRQLRTSYVGKAQKHNGNTFNEEKCFLISKQTQSCFFPGLSTQVRLLQTGSADVCTSQLGYTVTNTHPLQGTVLSCSLVAPPSSPGAGTLFAHGSSQPARGKASFSPGSQGPRPPPVLTSKS